ncbi:MAG: hypothetical protein AAFV80_08480 [Bacteroidota bacterium]
MKKLFLFALCVCCCWSCSTFIPGFVPEKKGQLIDEQAFQEADQYFWDQFHAGHYDSIPKVLEYLKRVYVQHPNDYRIAAHIGFAHSWALAESDRLESVPASITDHATLSTKYFEEAFQMHPEKEWRYYGFLTSMTIAEGSIHHDNKEVTRAYFQLKKSARKYPEFNLFTAAYTLAMSPRKQDRDKALTMLLQNLNKCLGEKIDLLAFNVNDHWSKIELDGKMSTCWNSWIAPHNLEGFLMILGDLLVRNGDLEAAANIYENVTRIPEYQTWTFKPQLEDRLDRTQQAINISANLEIGTFLGYDRCMVCHQEKTLTPSPEDVHQRIPLSATSLY